MNISDIANFGESGKLALSHAERMAKETRHDDIGPEHVFLGVAQLEDVNIRRQLQKTGVDIDEVSRAIRNGIKTGTAAAVPPSRAAASSGASAKTAFNSTQAKSVKAAAPPPSGSRL